MFGIHETLPAGTYFIGDPGYVLNDALLEKIQHHNGTVTINSEKLTITQLPFCGSGIIGSDKHLYCIDSLLFSMIPIQFCVKCGHDEMTELGSVHTFSHPIDYTVISDESKSTDKVIEISSKEFYLKLDSKNILNDEEEETSEEEEEQEDENPNDFIPAEEGFFMTGVTMLDDQITDDQIEDEDKPDKHYLATRLLQSCENDIVDAIKAIILSHEKSCKK